MKSFIALLCLCSLSPSLFARFVLPVPVPLDQMLKDAEDRRAADPANPERTYRLGRVHYLAFDLGVAASPSWNRDEPSEGLASREFTPSRERTATWEARKLTEAERIAHAEKAALHLSKALEMAPDNALYVLTAASFQKTWLESELKAEVKEEPLSTLNAEGTMGLFQKAWELGRKSDLKLEHLPITGRGGIVSGEAIRAWLAMADATGTGDAGVRDRMVADLKKLDALRFGEITPLVFHPLASAEDPVPVDSGAEVAFDLLGDGSGGRWNWPEPCAAFLVWDPAAVGDVVSGARMFGGYTWQMFWDDGFQPLRVLDANRDGRLTGAELNGLAAWFDDEQPGQCGDDEVFALSRLGVVEIRLDARAFSGPDALVWHPEGIVFADGRTVPLWDWLARLAP